MRPLYKNLSLFTVFSTLALGVAGCGSQEFRTSSSTESNDAPGAYFIPPRVDILLAEDDTGSMFEAYGDISTQLPRFLDGLQSKNWDYHFAVTPLTKARNFDQIVAGKYDTNWGSSWAPPFPGADFTAFQTLAIPTALFRFPGQYGGFLTRNDINNGLNGSEPGLKNIRDALTLRMGGTKFLRRDALLVVVIVGNGQDTSDIPLCDRGDGIMIPCPPNTWETGLTTYKAAFQGLKDAGKESLVKFYSAISTQNRTNCLGGGAYIGTRYKWMAENTGGQYYDVCSQSIASIVDGIATQLNTQRLEFRTRYLFLNQQPNPATIKVKIFRGGGGTGQYITQSSTNGFTYEGYLNNVYAIDDPIPMNQQSGWAVELHGSAKLVGEDRADIEFLPYGVNP